MSVALLSLAAGDSPLEAAPATLLALILIAAPAVGLLLLGGTLADWAPIYLAGAAGGLVGELSVRLGTFELPGPAVATPAPGGNDPSQRRHVDLGFGARMLLGGLAALVVSPLLAVAGAADASAALAEAVDSDVTVAWAVVYGAGSAAVWATLRALMESRVKTLTTALATIADLDESTEPIKKSGNGGCDCEPPLPVESPAAPLTLAAAKRIAKHAHRGG